MLYLDQSLLRGVSKAAFLAGLAQYKAQTKWVGDRGGLLSRKLAVRDM